MLESAANNHWLGWAQPLFRYLLSSTESPALATETDLMSQGIITLEQYKKMDSLAPRLEGFIQDHTTQKNIREKSPYGIPMLPMKDIKVIKEDVYHRWLQNDRNFTEQDLDNLKEEFENALVPNKRAVLRRAIYHRVERFTPSLQTYNDKSSVDAMMAALQDLYKKYAEQYPGDEFIHEAFFYPYVDPELSLNPHGAEILPVGGTIVPIYSLEDSNGRLTFEISVGYGDSAIHNTGHPEADRIIIHVDKPDRKNPVGTLYRAERLTEPFKNVMIVQRGDLPASWNAKPLTTTDGTNSDFFEVQIGQRVLDVTLPDNLVEALAIHLANCMWDSNTTRKIEFTLGTVRGAQGEDLGYQPFILENVPYVPPERNTGLQDYGIGELTATLIDANSLDELIELLGSSTSHTRPIVVCTPQFLDLARDDIALRHKVAAISTQLLILSRLEPTEHVARDWKDTHTLIPISSMNANEFLKASSTYVMGQKYHVRTIDGLGVLIPIGENEQGATLPPILSIRQSWLMGFDSAKDVGGKAKGLAALDRLHYPISDNSLTLTSTFFDQIIEHNNLRELVNQLDKVETPKELAQILSEIQVNLNDIPEELLDELLSRMAESVPDANEEELLFAFRSNLNLEDHGKHPMAGVYGSALEVKLNKQEVKMALLSVMKQYFNPATAQKIFDDMSGKDRRQKLKEILGSVLVQPRFESEFSGTLFSYNSSAPTSETRKQLTLQVSKGIGGVVDGSSALTVVRDRETETFLVTGRNGETIMSSTEFKQLHKYDASLGMPKHLIVNLLKLLKYAAKILNDEQDMEWAVRYDTLQEKWEIVFLQTRPILTV